MCSSDLSADVCSSDLGSRWAVSSSQQVEEFLKEQVAPALAKYQDCLKDEDTELKV